MFDRLLKDTTFVIFDIETTGFDPIQDQIIEIGAVKMDYNGNIIDSFSRFIKLYKKETLPEKIIELTHITDTMLIEEGEEHELVICDFFNFAKDAVLVAQNAKFDMSFLAAYNIQNFNTTYSRVCLDTINFAKALKPNQESYRLSELVNMFNVEYDKDAHHRADYDAKITAKVLLNQIKQLSLSEDRCIRDLVMKENAPIITEKQNSFLESLLDKKSITLSEDTYFNKQIASVHIDILLKI